MALYVKVPCYCSNCGKAMQAHLTNGQWVVCSPACRQTLDMKRCYSILGHQWPPNKEDGAELS